MSFDGAFELAVMMGHAFQCLVTDAEVRDSLRAVRRALAPGGRFVFENRNPIKRAWEAWGAMDPLEVVDPAGRTVRISYDVLAMDRDVVTLDEVTSDTEGRRLRAIEPVSAFLGAPTWRGI